VAIPTEIISAVIGALSGGGVSLAVHRQDVRNARVEETHRALLDLVALRGQMLDGQSQGLPPERMEVLVQRRALQLAVVETLIRKTKGRLTAHDWIALGCEACVDRDFQSALGHFERAVRLARDDDALTRAIALRNLGRLRYTAIGEVRDAAAGGSAFASAVQTTASVQDAYMRYNTGLSLAMWGAAETVAGAGVIDVDARAHLDEARACYEQAAATGYPQAAQALEQLALGERTGFALMPPPGHPHAPQSPLGRPVAQSA
jgi:hypothetical protein